MLLAVDAGNTQTVLGLFAGEKLRAMWRISTDRSRTADETGLIVRDLLTAGGFAPGEVTACVLASVVPQVTAAVREMAARFLGCEPLVVEHTLDLGVRLDVLEPAQVGADRIANACAAYAIHGGPVIVVDLGTATTFDVVTGDGAYCGGIICPGLAVAADQLVSRTARLPRVDLVAPETVIGRSTDQAMRSGIVWGSAMQIDGLVRLVWRELGTECRVVATGGYAGIVAPLTRTVREVDPDLTLYGLRLLYERNRPGERK